MEQLNAWSLGMENSVDPTEQLVSQRHQPPQSPPQQPAPTKTRAAVACRRSGKYDIWKYNILVGLFANSLPLKLDAVVSGPSVFTTMLQHPVTVVDVLGRQ
jgi:hypothetical protein